MIHVLHRLKRIWYTILFIATICLIADVTLFSTYSGANDIFFPLPLFADIPTVLIFAYALWGKSQPFLLPSASPKSNPCTRGIRIVGTLILALLWLMNTIIYGLSESTGRRVLAAFTALETVLILLEMIVSHNVGKTQRRLLKEEIRQQMEAEEVAAAASQAQNRRSETGQTTSGADSTVQDTIQDPLASSVRYGNRVSESDRRHGTFREESDCAVEIVRPAEVDPSTILINQQMMYEAYQKHQIQQYQLFLMAQQQFEPQWQQKLQSPELKGVDDNDDIPILTSQKIEIPSDPPNDPSIPTSTTMAGPPQWLHVPSAPPKSVLSQDSPKITQYQIQQHSGVAKANYSFADEDKKQQVVVEQCIPVMISLDLAQSKASAPPLQPLPFLAPPVPSLAPAPCLEMATQPLPQVDSLQALDDDLPKDAESAPEQNQQPTKVCSAPPTPALPEPSSDEVIIHMDVQESIAIEKEPTNDDSMIKTIAL